jgi:hypothetical protein
VRVKSSVTLPAELLKRLDRIDSNRSSLLEKAALACLAQLEKRVRDRRDHQPHRGAVEPPSARHPEIPASAVQRGELYLVRKPGPQDRRKPGVFEPSVSHRFALFHRCVRTRILRHDGLTTQVHIGVAEGLKAESSM